jgi:hypothetical protein
MSPKRPRAFRTEDERDFARIHESEAEPGTLPPWLERLFDRCREELSPFETDTPEGRSAGFLNDRSCRTPGGDYLFWNDFSDARKVSTVERRADLVRLMRLTVRLLELLKQKRPDPLELAYAAAEFGAVKAVVDGRESFEAGFGRARGGGVVSDELQQIREIFLEAFAAIKRERPELSDSAAIDLAEEEVREVLQERTGTDWSRDKRTFRRWIKAARRSGKNF